MTEGDHLYLDRNADWRARSTCCSTRSPSTPRLPGADTIVLRDLQAADRELPRPCASAATWRSLPDSLVYEPAAGSDEEWLAASRPRRAATSAGRCWRGTTPSTSRSCARRARAHRRRARPPPRPVPHVARSLDLNSFPLPRTSCGHARAPVVGADAAALRETGEAVAFGAHFAGARHYAPMVVGLDYDFVRSHRSYRQSLRHALLRARGPAPARAARHGRNAREAALRRACRSASRSSRRPTTTAPRCSPRSPRTRTARA